MFEEGRDPLKALSVLGRVICKVLGDWKAWFAGTWLWRQIKQEGQGRAHCGWLCCCPIHFPGVSALQCALTSNCQRLPPFTHDHSGVTTPTPSSLQPMTHKRRHINTSAPLPFGWKSPEPCVVFFSYCCCKRVPEAEKLKATQTCYLIVLEVRAKIKVSVGLYYFWRAQERIYFLAFPSSTCCLHFLALGPFFPIQSQQSSTFGSLSDSGPAPFFIQGPLGLLWAPWIIQDNFPISRALIYSYL